MRRDYVVEQATRRAERYWYEDGFWEIGFGLANILLAAYFLLARWLQDRGANPGLLLLLQFLAVVGIFFLMGRLVKVLKERVTYPRTGFVAYRKPSMRSRAWRIAQMALVSATIGALVAAIAALRSSLNLMPIVSGIIFAAMTLYLGARFSLLRLFLLAPLVIAMSVAVAFLSANDTAATAGFFIGVGLLFMLSGGTALAFYLRRTRPADVAED